MEDDLSLKDLQQYRGSEGYFNVMGFPVSTFYKLIKELIIT